MDRILFNLFLIVQVAVKLFLIISLFIPRKNKQGKKMYCMAIKKVIKYSYSIKQAMLGVQHVFLQIVLFLMHAGWICFKGKTDDALPVFDDERSFATCPVPNVFH